MDNTTGSEFIVVMDSFEENDVITDDMLRRLERVFRESGGRLSEGNR